jgi:hypothetical protein
MASLFSAAAVASGSKPGSPCCCGKGARAPAATPEMPQGPSAAVGGEWGQEDVTVVEDSAEGEEREAAVIVVEDEDGW